MLFNDISEKVLSNGLKIVCLKKNDVPIVSVQVWYKTGSVHERDGKRGISHFIEHLMFRGSKNVKSEEHAHRINDVGGHCNAFTSEDITAFMNSVPRDYLTMVLELEADRMSDLQIDQELFNTERRVIIEEYHTYMNNPVTKSFLEFRREFFKNHPYSYTPLGTLEDLQSVTVDQCYEYYRSWYVPNNAVVVIVGDITSEEDVFSRVEHHFGNKSRSQIPGTELGSIENTTQPGLMKRRVEFDVPILIMGYPAPSASNLDALSLEILQMALSGGETSRLHREVVRNSGMAVMAGGSNFLLKHSGISMFFAAFTPDIAAKKVEAALKQQVERIKSEGITDAEIEKIKNTLLTNHTFELYSAENICQRIGFSEIMEGDYRLWVKRLEALEKIDTSSVLDVARKYWDDSKRHGLYLQPRKVHFLMFVMGLFRRFFGKR